MVEDQGGDTPFRKESGLVALGGTLDDGDYVRQREVGGSHGPAVGVEVHLELILTVFHCLVHDDGEGESAGRGTLVSHGELEVVMLIGLDSIDDVGTVVVGRAVGVDHAEFVGKAAGHGEVGSVAHGAVGLGEDEGFAVAVIYSDPVILEELGDGIDELDGYHGIGKGTGDVGRSLLLGLHEDGRGAAVVGSAPSRGGVVAGSRRDGVSSCSHREGLSRESTVVSHAVAVDSVFPDYRKREYHILRRRFRGFYGNLRRVAHSERDRQVAGAAVKSSLLAGKREEKKDCGKGCVEL